jgi:hypothetical protein
VPVEQFCLRLLQNFLRQHRRTRAEIKYSGHNVDKPLDMITCRKAAKIAKKTRSGISLRPSRLSGENY